MAIPTIYEGIEYRSRLEARWAAFFARLGWRTTYEPFDGDGYIPDFLVHGKLPMLIEVKPAATPREYESPIEKINHGLRNAWPDGRVLIVGVDPLPLLDNPVSTAPVAGMLRDNGDWGAGLWHCGPPTPEVCHSHMSYACSPSGYYDGNPGAGWDDLNMIAVIRDAWARACNDVKWLGRPSGGAA